MKKAAKKRIIAYSTLCVLLYGVVSGCVYLFQDKLIFVPDKTLAATPHNWGLEFEDLYLETSDGAVINAWYIPAPRARGTVLFFHGNGGNISHRSVTIKMLHSMGVNVLMPDYRGYGKSSGKPSEEGIYEDALACWDFLIRRKGDRPRDIVVMGRSFGGAVAAQLAQKVDPAGLVLESTFTSIPDMAREAYPFLPVGLLARYEFNTLERMPGLGCPVLVIHSPDDEIIGFGHGKRIFEQARDPKSFLQISGSHNNGFFESGELYTRAMNDFLKIHLAQSPANSENGKKGAPL